MTRIVEIRNQALAHQIYSLRYRLARAVETYEARRFVELTHRIERQIQELSNG